MAVTHLGRRLRGERLRTREEVDAAALAHTAGAATALLRLRARDKDGIEAGQPPRRVKELLLHAARVNHERDAVDRHT